MTSLPKEDALPDELRELVSSAAALLGEVIREQAGEDIFRVVEDLRAQMAGVRGREQAVVTTELRRQFRILERLPSTERRMVARAFTLFLELMNACENAYRNHRLERPRAAPEHHPSSLVYVLTAHPTEARSPRNIAVFHGLQSPLAEALRGAPEIRWRPILRHQLTLAWRTPTMRERAPQVKDEAEHIYHTALRPEILCSLLEASREILPIYLRTWVGGDKDGHPGVDAAAMTESLTLARGHLLRFLEGSLEEVRETLSLLGERSLATELIQFRRGLRKLKRLRRKDGARVKAARVALYRFCGRYQEKIGSLHPSLERLKRLFHLFPALVVPLELREDSGVLMKPGKHAIDRMLKTLGGFAEGGEPRWYARGFIVSMTESVDHLATAERRMRAAMGPTNLPVIPLFESSSSLKAAPEIVTAMIRHPKLGACLRKRWGGQLEMMVGYSDSSKQAGVFPSRLAIAAAMHQLEQVCEKAGVRPIFFQGSGGSVDRGGGTVADQVAWWPRSALLTYKVTIQGEMVERSLSSPAITRGQIANIAESAGRALAGKPSPPRAPVLFRFAGDIANAYGAMIRDPDFLRIVGESTPYAYLSELKIGSRPASRAREVAGLRAIPWVLCWTQTRVLFQTWWGVGGAWQALEPKAREDLRRAFREEPVFTSFVKALDFTLAKVELPVWRIYLENSGLATEEIERFYGLFSEELKAAAELVRFVTAEPQPLWFRPWLGASIRLRSPMIHPLNLLQALAMKDGDIPLFRTTITGISAGMMTTG